MVASEDCAEKGGASYGHYAQALEKVIQLKRDMRRYIYEVTTIKSKIKHIRLSDELTNQYDLITLLFTLSEEDNPEEDPQIVDLFIEANAMNKKADKLVRKRKHNYYMLLCIKLQCTYFRQKSST